jgi:orotidine-5'-phosphate decarboxylase
VAALERVRAQIPPDIPFIADAKRGDISTTAARQEAAIFGALGSDAVTLNPYLGLDAIAPFLERSDRFVYVLCRTSNPGAAEIQALPGDDGQPLFRRVAQTIAGWTVDGRDRIGLVVGATASAELAQVRDIAPALPFLVPGVGAQRGDVDAVRANGGVRGGPASTLAGRGLLVNVSRGIASAALGVDDPEAAIRRSAEHWAVQLRA